MQGGFWVFGYGSLIWHPGFAFADRRLATLRGWRRAFCMTSIVYRGTPEAPGLVLALDADPEGHCLGVAYRVAGPEAAATLAYLRERELVSYAYDEVEVPVELEDGATVAALAYVSNRAHAQYRGGLDLEAQAEVIARASGPAGRMPTICSTPSRASRRSGCTTRSWCGWRSWSAAAAGAGRRSGGVQAGRTPGEASPFRAGRGVTSRRPRPYGGMLRQRPPTGDST